MKRPRVYGQICAQNMVKLHHLLEALALLFKRKNKNVELIIKWFEKVQKNRQHYSPLERCALGWMETNGSSHKQKMESKDGKCTKKGVLNVENVIRPLENHQKIVAKPVLKNENVHENVHKKVHENVRKNANVHANVHENAVAKKAP